MNEKDIKAGEIVRDRIMSVIIGYIDVHQYAPSVREICKMVGLKSTSSVQSHLETLKLQGRIKTNASFGSPRSISVPGYKFVRIPKNRTNENIKKAITRLSVLLSMVERSATPRNPLNETRWALMCGIEALEREYALAPDEVSGGLHCPICKHVVGASMKFCSECGRQMKRGGEDEKTEQ